MLLSKNPKLLFRGPGGCVSVCASRSISKKNFHGKILFYKCFEMIQSSPLTSSLSVYEKFLCRLEFKHGNGTGGGGLKVKFNSKEKFS